MTDQEPVERPASADGTRTAGAAVDDGSVAGANPTTPAGPPTGATPPGETPAAPANVAAPSAPSSGADLDRRRFFREFASEVFHTAATVVGAASALQRSSAEAASALLNPPSAEAPAPPAIGAGQAVTSTAAGGPVATGAGPGTAAGYRSAFRVEGDRIAMVDQRRLPDRLVEIDCRTAIDVANEIRAFTIRGGPVLGLVSAAGMALSAQRVRGSRPYARRAILRAAANTLIAARPTPRHVAAAVDRVMGAYEAIGDLDEDGDRIADAIQAEADAILYEAADDHARLASTATEHLPRPEGRPLAVLTLGSTGALGGGQFGTALGAIQTAVYAGREVHVYVLEGRPWLDGARVATWELAQAQIPHTLIADSAAGWLLASGRVDAVLVGAERIARNGDLANDVGTYPVAVLANRHEVPFIVCSPLAALDSTRADGTTFPFEERPSDDLVRLAGTAIAPAGTPVLNPVADMTPAALITGIATEEGFLAAREMPLAMAAVARAQRSRAAADELALPSTAHAVVADDLPGDPTDEPSGGVATGRAGNGA